MKVRSNPRTDPRVVVVELTERELLDLVEAFRSHHYAALDESDGHTFVRVSVVPETIPTNIQEPLARLEPREWR